MSTRHLSAWYEDAQGAEQSIMLEVCADGLRDIEIAGELPDMPDAEEQSLRERVREAYWALEHEAWQIRQDRQEESDQ